MRWHWQRRLSALQTQLVLHQKNLLLLLFQHLILDIRELLHRVLPLPAKPVGLILHLLCEEPRLLGQQIVRGRLLVDQHAGEDLEGGT